MTDNADGNAFRRRRLRVFLSSPGDVVDERRMAQGVLERLQGEFAQAVDIRPMS